MPRPTWKGYLKLSLVSCAVALYSATSASERVSFNTLNRKTGNRLKIGDAGGFTSDYIMGIDGKTPVVVENNWSWNIQHGIKGKARQLKYKDEFGNEFDVSDVNANQGKFDWSDKTAVYFR